MGGDHSINKALQLSKSSIYSTKPFFIYDLTNSAEGNSSFVTK
ncbi:hypothetical protein ATN83_p20184 (plasmid) [Raoultella ornithinolytica]|uniref:Uncharacterized protein n=1 Tax=Raoultella ornithinolytica TaxID=54291 RepID=A0A6B7PZ44_RAOOR|nr:hypothetical protein ATN83_p20184 [Raoultella ornithinolytica]EJU28487.1 hypothetical protein HMPREF1144_0834 [Klebsiella sp. OBRC7]QFX77993.1 hypothetical protein [Raoultella ornithinolytica]